MKDNRYQFIKKRLLALTLTEVQRIKDNIDKVCFDTFNFDSSTETFCPLAIGMNLHNTIDNPTDELVAEAISKRFTPVNVLKGVEGNFYRENRREDLLILCEEVIKLRS